MEATSALAGFHADLYLGGTGIYNVGFREGRKTEEPGKKHSEQVENQQQTNFVKNTIQRTSRFQLCSLSYLLYYTK